MSDLPIPVTFRKDIVRKVLDIVTGGDSCSLVGVGSSGKSNVARHLARLDVPRYYLGDAASSLLVAYVDCQKLVDSSAQALHTLILEALPRAAKQAKPETAAVCPQLESFWEQAAESASPDRARRLLENALDAVLGAGIAQIGVILDDFDPVVRSADGRTLNSLRAVRDERKARVMYVTVTRRELGFLRDEREFQDFYEIAAATTIAVGPYDEDDASFMIDRLCARWGFAQRLSDDERDRVMHATGRHAGLLLETVRAARHDRALLSAPDLVERLRRHKDIAPECDKIWESLDEAEMADLRAVVTQGWPAGDEPRPLLKKGLLRRRLDGAYDVFSPVFAEYVWDHLPNGRYAIKFLPDQRAVRVYDRVVKDLDDVDMALFGRLYERRGRRVDAKDLIDRMLTAERSQHRFPGPPYQRMMSHMAELKRKIDSAAQAYILAEADGSYRLIGPDGA